MTVNKRYIKWIVGFWLAIAGGAGGLFVLMWTITSGMWGSLPTFEELENPQSNIATEVFSSDGQLLGNYFRENRSNVLYEDLSPNLVNALIATEDVRFKDHSGVDFRGLGRVLIRTVILRQGTGGGSTISQQLAKNLFPRKELSKMELVIQKLKEWIIAAQLEKSYTKEEILAMYLNTVPFGSHSYGIKTAARTFFNTTQDSLEVQEAAVLVGLLKAPSFYNPRRNPERSKGRRNTVMGQMKKYGYLEEAVYDSLSKLPIELSYRSQGHRAGQATYFREYLRGQISEWCKTHTKPKSNQPYNLYRDGLKIYTTIDSKMQRYAEQAVSEHLGGELQAQFFKHWEGVKNAPFYHLSKQEMENSMNGDKRRSKRYNVMIGKECGNCGRRGDYVSAVKVHAVEFFKCSAEDCGYLSRAIPKDSIDIVFNLPVKMRVYSSKGEVDTILSPMDSILYYKYFLHAGFMSMDPHSGHVKAWVGGINYKHFQYDHVKLAKRQVGSTFKPFVYTMAMDAKWSPCTKIPNVPVTFEKGEYNILESWTPRNSGSEFNGLMLSLKFGLANSINWMTAYVMKQIGPDPVIKMAERMGITSYLDPQPSLCLGTSDVSVYEMVGAYSTFANKGVWTEPIIVTRIEDSKGNVLEEFIPKRVEAMSEETASLMVNMLMGVVDGVYDEEAGKKIGTAVRLKYKYKLKGQIAGKTGTTQNYSDGWFLGVTPNLVSGVWVGCEDRSVHFRRMSLGQGANMALPVWALYMKKLYADNSSGYTEEDKFDLIPGSKMNVELNCTRYNYLQSNDMGDSPDPFD
ncbi:MAG: penicillin-binding protein [Flavobacteriales bacterium]|nr:penicillin-binding protein [Flavobacteriales bacterium]